ncbi:MAG: alpha-amylase family glycosyl hydrolase [Caldilineales bacterium]|nr:alpha-amylase family glycosyl hydrolase [Caldilineales bacterium]MDW8316556.1 alpha-amylase family glycosyl hydrolase [Anaerolineae bacterium]
MLHPSLPSWLRSVHHDGSETYLSNPYPALGETVRLRLRTGVDAPVQAVFVRTAPDGEQAITRMTPGPVQPPVRWWEADLPVTEPTVHYRFVLRAEDGVWWLTAAGPTFYDPLDSSDFRLLADYRSPAWLADAVFYQIFPDRFANGDPSNDPRGHEFTYRGAGPQTYPWGTLPPADAPFPLVFYGGDLDGIVARLGYLQDLGVNALYLNPIFPAHSNHRYDVVDYERVDPLLGGDEALIRLRRALDERGMRYILDIVPNHCGYGHPWFQRAREDPLSPEAQFFTFTRHPDEYVSWLGVWTLPKLNYRSQELRRRMYAGPDGVFRRWLRPPFSADGWRIDVANMLARSGPAQLGLEVAREIRRAVKETRPDAYLMGEHFYDATDQLQGDCWDGVMNYLGFFKPLRHWLSGFRQFVWGQGEVITSPGPWPTQAMAAAWQAHLGAIPWAVALQQYNVVGSHDTPRIRSVVAGNDALHRLAVAVQMTFPGVPALYYGDEIGLTDRPPLGSRDCMVWDEGRWNRSLRDFYRRLVHLRRGSAALQRGGFQILAVEQDMLAYQREHPGGRVLVVAQRSASPRPAGPLPVAHGGLADGARLRELFTGQEATVANGALPLPELPQGATVWIEG